MSEPLNLIAIINYIHNKKIDLSSYKNGYINDQNTGAVSKLKFGTTTMDNNGCEVIAAYNAMKTLGNQKDIRDIAYHFENDGQMLKGEFGTNPYANKRYFEKEGYKEYIEKLSAVYGKEITSYQELKDAMVSRLDYFETLGSKLSDHALQDCPYIYMQLHMDQHFQALLVLSSYNRRF